MAARITLPSCEDLSAEPQLAILTVLEAAADIAVLALGAEYPELACRDVELGEPPELRAALNLVESACALERSLHRYRRALRDARMREEEEDDLLPF